MARFLLLLAFFSFPAFGSSFTFYTGTHSYTVEPAAHCALDDPHTLDCSALAVTVAPDSFWPYWLPVEAYSLTFTLYFRSVRVQLYFYNCAQVAPNLQVYACLGNSDEVASKDFE